LDLAEQLFLAGGFEAVSMDDLAERSGVSKPVIYDHFRSKEGLFRAILDQHADALSTSVAVAVAGADGAEARFRAGSRAFFAWVAERGQTITVVLDGVGNATGVQDQVRVLGRNQVQQTSSMLGESLRLSGVTMGAGDTAELVPVAEMLSGAYEALALWWQREAPEIGTDDITDRFCRLMWPGLSGGVDAGRVSAGWVRAGGVDARTRHRDH
jgi:AcrR family transcriptional regulator